MKKIYLVLSSLCIVSSVNAASYSSDRAGYNNADSQRANNRSYYTQDQTDMYDSDNRMNQTDMYDSDSRMNQTDMNSSNRRMNQNGMNSSNSRMNQYSMNDLDSKTNLNSSDSKMNTQDNELLDRVQAAVRDNDGKWRDVQVHVIRNTVIITGSVLSEQDRKDLKSKIEKIRGVQKVDDQLKLKMQSSLRTRGSADRYISMNNDESVMSEDHDLKMKVEEELKPGMFSEGYRYVQVSVNKGVVTLSGTVQSKMDRQEVLDRVNKVNGVRSVKDQMTVKN